MDTLMVISEDPQELVDKLCVRWKDTCVDRVAGQL